ncbi:aldo/keto reductase [Tessaracoccus aquimaris]|uniref:Aldo/keto reductase n=1 Tax=Tessaracoccus aquimaris TaxID=1332264 RepID=A0A1Q2CLM9_9ACTN|nr:aldo/keto reductase [Tessaracoccus aquimaris]AQP47028.1 aldo/keto reductase [Tessaracoccus aquimaris]
MTTPQRRLGQFTVSAIGYGAMPVSMSDSPVPEREQGIATVHAALDAGITLIDTADIYAPSWDAMGHNEALVGEALAGWSGDREPIVIATKAGITRGAGETWGRNATLDYLRGRVEASLRNLRVDTLDLLYLHRPDRSILYSQAIENLAVLKQEGLVAEIGVSNANVEEIEIAVDVLGESGLAAVQNEFSPRFNHTSKDELEYCGKNRVAFLPWSPLGGTGGGAKRLGERFPAILSVAEAHGVSVQQVTLAWELALGSHVIPIPGASRPESITDSALAMSLALSDDEVAALSSALL